jgi:hypothetical protein
MRLSPLNTPPTWYHVIVERVQKHTVTIICEHRRRVRPYGQVELCVAAEIRTVCNNRQVNSNKPTRSPFEYLSMHICKAAGKHGLSSQITESVCVHAMRGDVALMNKWKNDSLFVVPSMYGRGRRVRNMCVGVAGSSRPSMCGTE